MGVLITLALIVIFLAMMAVGIYMLYALWYKENPHFLKPVNYDYWSKRVYEQYGKKGLKIMYTPGAIAFILFPVWFVIWYLFIFNN